MKLLKKILACTLSATMLLSFTACNSDSTESETSNAEASNEELIKITFCLDWTPNTNHTGVYVAKQLGYYKDAGLDVEIVQPPEDGAVLTCATGQAQFAVGYQDTMVSAIDSDEPLGVTAIAAITQHNSSGILSRKSDNINSPKDLTGKTYSTWNLPIELAMLKNVVNSDGGDFDKVKLIPNDITDEPAALQAKQTDAIWVYYSWGGINAAIENVGCNYLAFKDLNPTFDYYSPVILANNDFLKTSPEIVKKFIEATKKGYEYAVTNPKDAADMLIKGDNTGSLNGSKDLVYASQEWLASQYLDDNGKWGTIDPTRWNNFYKWLFDNSLITHDLTNKGFTTDYISE